MADRQRLASPAGFSRPGGGSLHGGKRSRWPRTRKGLLVALPVLLAGLLLVAASPWWHRWGRLPVTAREAAELAVQQARQGPALRWATDLLSQAEDDLRAGLTEEHLQSARYFFRRDYRATAGIYNRAREEAQQATLAGQQALAEARAVAEAAIAAADEAVEAATKVASRVPLPKAAQATYQQARVHLSQARLLQESGELKAAATTAHLSASEAQEVARRGTAAISRFADTDQIAIWTRWVEETLAWSRQHGKPAVLIVKERNRLYLYSKGKRVASYDVDLGRNRVSFKQSAGDAATPEGRYHIVAKKSGGQTQYYKALLLDYPNAEDRERFARSKRAGTIPRSAKIGQLIEIHGEGGRQTDWTKGCIALANQDMDSLYARVEAGTPVTIVGGDGRGGQFSGLLSFK
jgi:lipoprotein-anchoring transpeptidase ErfK/SrfK